MQAMNEVGMPDDAYYSGSGGSQVGAPLRSLGTMASRSAEARRWLRGLDNKQHLAQQQGQQQGQLQDKYAAAKQGGLVDWWQWVMQQNLDNMKLMKLAGAINQANIGLSLQDYGNAVSSRGQQ